MTFLNPTLRELKNLGRATMINTASIISWLATALVDIKGRQMGEIQPWTVKFSEMTRYHGPQENALAPLLCREIIGHDLYIQCYGSQLILYTCVIDNIDHNIY